MAPASGLAALIYLKSLPVGYRFRPTDEELINDYLKPKINGRISPANAAMVPVIDVCKFEPWDLKHKSVIPSDDPEWFFFAARDRKYSSGQRTNRATKKGYWKATGKDRTIKSRNGVKGGSLVVVGMKRTLVFHKGRAPKGKRTCWIMHEYRTVQEELESSEQEGYVLCRLFEKTEEKSPDVSPETDEIEKNDNSPTLSGASNQKDDLEEVVKLSCEKSPELHYNEERAVPAGSTQERVPQWNDNIVSDSVGHDDLEVMGEGKSLLYAITECDAANQNFESSIFSDITSPIRPCNDYSLLDNYNALNHTFEKAEDDSMTEFLNDVLRNEEDYSPEVCSSHAGQFADFVPGPPVYDLDLQGYSPLESIHTKERTSSRGLEHEVPFQQDLCVFMDSDGYYDLLEVNNQEILNDGGICSAGNGIASCIHQISQHSSNKDEAISMKNFDENGFSSVSTGITIRPCLPQHHSENAVPKQGDAFRRLRLQNSFHVGFLSSIITESRSGNQADLQDELSSVEDGESAQSYTTGEEVSGRSYENKPLCCSDNDEISSKIRTEDDPLLTYRPNNAGFKMCSIFVNLKKSAPISSSKIFATSSNFVPMAYLTLVLVVLVPCIGAWWNFGRVPDRPV